MAKVAHFTPPAVVSKATGSQPTEAGRTSADRRAAPLSDSPRRGQAVYPRLSDALDTVAPPSPGSAGSLAGLPDLAGGLALAGLKLAPGLLAAHENAMRDLLGATEPDALSGHVAHAASTLDAVYVAFRASLPPERAAAGQAHQELASSLMAHALLINQIHRQGAVPADLQAFFDATFERPPSDLGMPESVAVTG